MPVTDGDDNGEELFCHKYNLTDCIISYLSKFIYLELCL